MSLAYSYYYSDLMEENHAKFPVLGPGIGNVCAWKLGQTDQKCPHTVVKRPPPPKIYKDILEAVGRTPMVRINRIPELEGFPETEFCKVE